MATLFARSRGIELKHPIGDWVYLLKPISALNIPPSKQYTILHPIATRLTPHTPQSLKSACDTILLLLQYHEPDVSQKLSDLRVPLVKGSNGILLLNSVKYIWVRPDLVKFSKKSISVRYAFFFFNILTSILAVLKSQFNATEVKGQIKFIRQ